ncbi:MAG: DHHA1 domain-containing protein, partial [Planctomycetota bacterium]
AVMNRTELPVVEKARMRADLAKLQEHAKKAQKQAAKAGAADVMARADAMLAEAEQVGGVTIVAAEMGSATADQMRVACDSLRARAGSAAIFLASEIDGKVLLLAAMTPDAVGKGVKAGDLIKAMAPIVGGKGGGRPDMAQGGGTKPESIPDAVREATVWLRGKLE